MILMKSINLNTGFTSDTISQRPMEKPNITPVDPTVQSEVFHVDAPVDVITLSDLGLDESEANATNILHAIMKYHQAHNQTYYDPYRYQDE